MENTLQQTDGSARLEAVPNKKSGRPNTKERIEKKSQIAYGHQSCDTDYNYAVK
jgi:hypothetical protein